MTTTTTKKTKKITITMSERRPLSIDPDRWPVIASADEHDGAVREQANRVWEIRVREHKDGRRIVYGWAKEGPGGSQEPDVQGGFFVEPVNWGTPNDDETVRAIRRMGGIIEDEALASKCIGDLPAETIDDVADDRPAIRISPIDALMGKVRTAIAEYDQTGDHTKHGPGADCIRCRLECADHR